jgi:Flp pilus assembly protein TadG
MTSLGPLGPGEPGVSKERTVIRTFHAQRDLRREDGAAAVEFAIVAGLLFMIVFGIIVFGILFSQYQSFTAAAREGARVAAVRGDSAQIQAAAENATPYEIQNTPTANITCDDDSSGDPVTVSWNQEFEIDIPFVPPMTPNVVISGTFRCE